VRPTRSGRESIQVSGRPVGGGSGENIARVTETDQDIGGFEILSQGSLASVPAAFRHPGRFATEEGEAQEKEEERAEGETTPRLFSL